jgi:predicted ATPase
MLIKRLKVSGLLSFGPTGTELPLGRLNVIIGPNGSGKSNVVEAVALLKAAPTNLPAPIKEVGGIREWLWKSSLAYREAEIEAVLAGSGSKGELRHGFRIADHGGRFEVADEWIEHGMATAPLSGPFVYRFNRGNPVLHEQGGAEREMRRETIKPEQSILAQVRDPERYPELARLQEGYEQIRLFRNWSFGPNAALRHEQSTHGRADFLADGGENLALVLGKIRSRIKPDLLPFLQKLYDGIEDFEVTSEGGNALLFLVEKGRREIPATRLSDGTLRYLCLLAILLHPNPPPLVVIEEPELGLHPDVIPTVAELLRKASERMQLLVTTHSRMLVDALGDDPTSVVVCSKENGESRLERLDAERLKAWLEKYSLGTLWSMGELGGNRW